ncbi:MAG: SprB repeat-containing protein [Bacteroidetes bacterium]|nr:SprB repeat-containing protein [Bacteroidota bacterium]
MNAISSFFITIFIICAFSLTVFSKESEKFKSAAAPFTLTFVVSDYNGVNVSCNGASDGSIDMTIIGGTAPFNILWSSGATTEDLTGIAGGTYTVTVIDADLDTTIDVVQIVEPDLISVSLASVDSVSCYSLSDGAINIDVFGGVGGYQFLWSNGSLTEDVSGLIAGNYSVTITDDNGCLGVFDTLVSQPDSIELGLVTVDANAAPDGFASVSPTGGTPPYTYQWSNGETSDLNFNLLPGSYTITVTDANLCTATDVAVIFNALGPCAIIVDSILSTSCPGLLDGAIYIDVFAAISPVTYLWSNGASHTGPNRTSGRYLPQSQLLMLRIVRNPNNCCS